MPPRTKFRGLIVTVGKPMSRLPLQFNRSGETCRSSFESYEYNMGQVLRFAQDDTEATFVILSEAKNLYEIHSVFNS